MGENGLKDVLFEMAGKIDGLVVTGVVGSDGVPIVMYEAPGNKLDPELVGAQFGEVLRIVANGTHEMGTGEIEDNVTTTSGAYLLTKPIGDGSCYLGVATSKETSLGMLRIVAKNYTDKLWASMPGK